MQVTLPTPAAGSLRYHAFAGAALGASAALARVFFTWAVEPTGVELGRTLGILAVFAVMGTASGAVYHGIAALHGGKWWQQILAIALSLVAFSGLATIALLVLALLGLDLR
jgi:hypothetical protein